MATTALALDNRQARFSDSHSLFAREREIAMRDRASRARSAGTLKMGDSDAVGMVLQRVQEQFDLSAATIGQAAIDAATAAVELLKASTDAFADDPGLMDNFLGIALTLLAELEGGTLHLEEARRAFEAARAEWAQQKNTHAAWLRATINLAAIIWQIGERSPAEAPSKASQEAAEILHSALPALPSSSPDRSRALDLLGNVLMTLGRTSDAIEAYQAGLAALPRRHDPAKRARPLHNLGTAYAAAHRYDEAIKVYEQAIALQPPDHFPRAWGRTQNYLAEALSKRAEEKLSEEASGEKIQSEVRRYWAAATKAYKAALTTKDPQSVADGWLVTVIDLANLLTNFGELELRILRVSGRWESENAPVDKLLEAIKLYETALPWSKELDRESIQKNLAFAHGAIKSCFDILVSMSAAYLTDNISILTTMSDNVSDVAREVRALLASSKLPQGQWKAALTEVLSSLEPQTSDQSASPSVIGELTKAEAAPPLPKQAPELYTERSVRPELGRKENVIEFLTRVYGQWIKVDNAVLERRDLRRLDSVCEMALRSWLHSNNNTLPRGIYIPTKSQVINQMVTSGSVPEPLLPRIGQTLARRRQRKAHSP